MSIETSEPDELAQSRLANTSAFPIVGQLTDVMTSTVTDNGQSIAKFVTDDGRARAFRVTLSRIDRQDKQAPNVNGINGGSLLFPPQGYSFTAGDADNVNSFNPPFGVAVPPRRSNPVWGTQVPSSSAAIAQPLVQIAWGQTNGPSFRLIADWPAEGSSIVLEGSYCEVFWGVSASPGNPPILNGATPTVGAQITPVEGVTEEDGELSISQSVTVSPFVGNPTNPSLLTDGVAHKLTDALGGFISEDAINGNSAVPCSTVFNTAPFTGWNATIVPIDPFPAAVNPASPVAQQLDIWPTQTENIFDLHDNMIVDDTGTLIPQAGSTAIRYGATGAGSAKTVAQLEALVNTSTLYKVSVPDSANAAKFLFPGLSSLSTYVPEDVGQPDVGEGIIVFGTQGAAVYVPDFARRVHVVLTNPDTRFGSFAFRVPLSGDPNCQLVWYDDLGFVIDAALQSTVTPSAQPPVWHAVPARAVMLGIYSDNTASSATLQALVHWRIHP